MGTTVEIGRRGRFRPALTTDLPVLVALLLAWLLVPVTWAHVGAGLGLAAAVLLHLRTRRGLARRVLRRARPGGSVAWAVAWVLCVAVALVSATGSLRLLGVPPDKTWHGGTGYVLLTAVALHLWLVRHRLRARLRRGRRTQ